MRDDASKEKQSVIAKRGSRNQEKADSKTGEIIYLYLLSPYLCR